MSDLADLYPGFASHWVDTDAGRIFARSGGAGPPLVCLHGFPQTHVMWHRIAPVLAQRFTLVLPDLRGYGWSSAPGSTHGALYAKRVMAQDVVTLMEALGHVRFRLLGHDRGARVGYRLALDHPGRIEKLALLDIAPTLDTWEGMDKARALKMYHWLFLAQPEPLPEKMIGADPLAYLDHKLADWSAGKSLAVFDPRALAHYRAAFNEPSRIHAMCEDYRAGAGVDHALDEADRAAGRRIETPLLALWGSAGNYATGAGPLEAWRRWSPGVTGAAIDSGHFLAEENPDATAKALLDWFEPS